LAHDVVRCAYTLMLQHRAEQKEKHRQTSRIDKTFQ